MKKTWAALLDEEAALPPGFQAQPLRSLVSLLEGESEEKILRFAGEPGRALRAFHVLQWRRESRFCGACGAANTDAPDELARLCPACGRREYPRISPAIIVLVTGGEDQILLAHNRNFTAQTYSLIAGFNEPGECLEATVARELREEVGIEVDRIRYAASQPWPFPNSLMIGFTARYAGGLLRPDGVEITDAQWFRRDTLPRIPGAGSLSRCLIDRWFHRRSGYKNGPSLK